MFFFLFLKLFFILAISAFETGTSEKAATEKCSLSIINQLCGLGQIELCLSSQKKKEKLCFAHNVAVSVDKKLINNVLMVLEELKIKPMEIVSIYWLLLLHQHKCNLRSSSWSCLLSHSKALSFLKIQISP